MERDPQARHRHPHSHLDPFSTRQKSQTRNNPHPSYLKDPLRNLSHLLQLPLNEHPHANLSLQVSSLRRHTAVPCHGVTMRTSSRGKRYLASTCTTYTRWWRSWAKTRRCQSLSALIPQKASS